MSGECILTGNWTADFCPGWTERLSLLTSPNSGPPEDVCVEQNKEKGQVAHYSINETLFFMPVVCIECR